MQVLIAQNKTLTEAQAATAKELAALKEASQKQQQQLQQQQQQQPQNSTPASVKPDLTGLQARLDSLEASEQETHNAMQSVQDRCGLNQGLRGGSACTSKLPVYESAPGMPVYESTPTTRASESPVYQSSYGSRGPVSLLHELIHLTALHLRNQRLDSECLQQTLSGRQKAAPFAAENSFLLDFARHKTM